MEFQIWTYALYHFHLHSTLNNENVSFDQLFFSVEYLFLHYSAFLSVPLVGMSVVSNTVDVITLTSENFYEKVYHAGYEGDWLIVFGAPVLSLYIS